VIGDVSVNKIIQEIEKLALEQVILILISLLIFIYLILTKTKRGRSVRKKFRVLPQLIPIDDEYETEIKKPQHLDGSSRQLKGEIIEDEHKILNELLGQKNTEELSGFDEEDAATIEEQDMNVPLHNQNFSSMKGKVTNAADEQEFCAECKKPVKPEWKACPFCGEFLEIYED
tara:strand:+ start:758 stop:1276 length:519 start_codon:yes stop_codon:yes gene_type:complete